MTTGPDSIAPAGPVVTGDGSSRPTSDNRGTPLVDMSPAAIERRLAVVSALHKLMRSLLTAVPSAPPR